MVLLVELLRDVGHHRKVELLTVYQGHVPAHVEPAHGKAIVGKDRRSIQVTERRGVAFGPKAFANVAVQLLYRGKLIAGKRHNLKHGGALRVGEAHHLRLRPVDELPSRGNVHDVGVLRVAEHGLRRRRRRHAHHGDHRSHGDDEAADAGSHGSGGMPTGARVPGPMRLRHPPPVDGRRWYGDGMCSALTGTVRSQNTGLLVLSSVMREFQMRVCP